MSQKEIPADLRSQLQTNLGESFAIERELGGGGMSRVFVAREVQLSRKVVIKVLNPELVEDLNAQRFERQILLAASLQQANIVPVLSAGDVDGLPYFTMPFVEGESLRTRLNGNGWYQVVTQDQIRGCADQRLLSDTPPAPRP